MLLSTSCCSSSTSSSSSILQSLIRRSTSSAGGVVNHNHNSNQHRHQHSSSASSSLPSSTVFRNNNSKHNHSRNSSSTLINLNCKVFKRLILQSCSTYYETRSTIHGKVTATATTSSTVLPSQSSFDPYQRTSRWYSASKGSDEVGDKAIQDNSISMPKPLIIQKKSPPVTAATATAGDPASNEKSSSSSKQQIAGSIPPAVKKTSGAGTGITTPVIHEIHDDHEHLDDVVEEEITISPLPKHPKERYMQEIDGYVFKSKKPRRDISLERNFITPVRAMSDFLLKSTDLEGLRKTMRRSPHADEPPITVFWRKDVEAKATEVWGNLNEMLAERMKREAETYEYNEAVFNVKRILKKYRQHTKEQIKLHSGPTSAGGVTTERVEPKKHPILGNLLHGSGKIVLTAISINGTNFVIKLIAWTLTGSHSLFAEAIHSLADTINQCILAYGIHKSTQRANLDHPYGYANMRHVASLISGVGIFCIGSGLSIYHGIHGLLYQEPIQSLYWAFFILAGSFLSESATLFLAVNSVRERAKAKNISFKEFILRGVDPSLNVVILEDTAAVTGVAVAASCMAMAVHYGSSVPDAVGSLVIGGLLGGVASFIIYSNSAALVGRSIPRENLDRINVALESDVMIRAIHDVKGIDMGNTQVRYKAEVDFDGRELTRAYLEKLDLVKMLEEVKALKTSEEFENFLLHHGENIVDTLGAEIDRIENQLKKDHPEVRHCDLEIL